ncbi:baeRF2 domain-containing protein [Arthrobacter sp. TMN-37]
MTHALKDHSGLYKVSGPWTTIYVDGSAGTDDSFASDDILPRTVADAMQREGAPKEDVKAAMTALSKTARGLPDPVSRFVLVCGGEAAVDDFLPGGLVTGAPVIAVGPVPDLSPLARHCPGGFAYVVAEVGRDGGEVYLRRADREWGAPDRGEPVAAVEGDTEHMRKVHGGGWAHGRYQHHAEKVWKSNAAEVAAEIDRTVSATRAKLVVLSGDIRARQLVADQVSEETRALLGVVDSHTRTGGSDAETFTLQVDQLVTKVMADEQHHLLERLAEHEGQASGSSAAGIEAVVAALQQAQVDTLLLESTAWDDRTLLALDAPPWIATAEEGTSGAEVLGKVPALAAILRAAALTDADTVMYPAGALESKSIAALLRWPTGPAVPSAT